MKKAVLFMIFLFLLLYIIPLGVRPLVIPDETRYAEIPREMISSGDWVVPRLNGLLYFEKPVMGYWLNAISMSLFGENAFAIRLPSALSAGLSALMIFFLVRAFAGGSRRGLMASGIYLSSILVVCVGVFSTLDSMFSFFLTASIGLFFLSWHNRTNGQKYYLYLILAGVFCGFACHTKGFLAIVIPVIIIFPFLVWEGDWKSMLKVPWIPVGVALLVMLPWGIMIHIKEPDFWNFFFWNEHIRRFMAEDAQHKAPFYYFMGVLPFAALPWTFLLPAALKGFLKKGINSSFLKYSICWFVFPFLFFSFSSGKLATYILPCFPPLAILFALGLSGFFESDNYRRFNTGALILAVLCCVPVLVLFLIQLGIIHEVPVFQSKLKAIVFAFGLFSFSAFLVASVFVKKPAAKITLYMFSPLIFFFSFHFLMPDLAVLKKTPGEFLMKHADKIDKETILVSGSAIQAVCWYYKRSDVYLLNSRGELEYGLEKADSKHRLLDIEMFNDLVVDNLRNKKIILIVSAKKYKRLEKQLPAPLYIDSNSDNGFVLAQY